jgi:hypothetical protein
MPRCYRGSAGVQRTHRRAETLDFLFFLRPRELQLGPDAGPQTFSTCAQSSASPRALRCALPRFEASGESVPQFDARGGRVPFRPCLRVLARCPRRRGGQWQARVDLGEALVTPDVLAPADDATPGWIFPVP